MLANKPTHRNLLQGLEPLMGVTFAFLIGQMLPILGRLRRIGPEPSLGDLLEMTTQFIHHGIEMFLAEFAESPSSTPQRREKSRTAKGFHIKLRTFHSIQMNILKRDERAQDPQDESMDTLEQSGQIRRRIGLGIRRRSQ